MKKALLILFFTVTLLFPAKSQYTKLLDFNGSNGSNAHGALVSDGTFLYGMTQTGGTGYGKIFKIKPDGSGYATLLIFAGSSNGGAPYGSLLLVGTNLYGMTNGGGTTGYGVVFKIKTDGTGYSKLLDFTSVNGGYPYGSLITDGTFLYGMTHNGGTAGLGVIFKIKFDGTGYAKLLDFVGATNGSYPYGSLVSDGTFLYGMTYGGGSSTGGTIFKIMPDGTGYVKLLDFSGTSGSQPFGDLTYDGTYLYGMTAYGTIFKIKPDGTSFVTMYTFGTIAMDGQNPTGSLILNGTTLYGLTNGGGSSTDGTIFKIKSDGTGYTKLFDFTGTATGQNPVYATLLYNAGSLFGMTYIGGANSKGVIFGYGISTDINESSAETNLNIFPNPSNGIFTIKVDDANFLMGALSIYNVLGENIYSNPKFTNQSSNKIDLSNSPKGIYFVEIENETKKYVSKIIVQ